MQFLGLHAFAISLHLFCGIYSFMSPHAYDALIPITINTVEYSNSVSNAYYDVTGVSYFNFPSVIIIYGIVAFVTIVFHLFIYFPIHYKYGPIVWNQGFFTVRWIEYSITCTLMSFAASTSSGPTMLSFTLTMAVQGIALQFIGALIEQLKRYYVPLLFVGVLINTGLSFSTFLYIITAPTIDQYQWIEFLSFAFYYGLFPLNCIIDARRKNCFVKTDWIYNVLSLSSKFGLFWLQVGEVEEKLGSNTWTKVQIYLLGIVVPFVMLCVGIYFTPSCDFSSSSEEKINTNVYWKTMKQIAKLRIIKDVDENKDNIIPVKVLSQKERRKPFNFN